MGINIGCIAKMGGKAKVDGLCTYLICFEPRAPNCLAILVASIAVFFSPDFALEASSTMMMSQKMSQRNGLRSTCPARGALSVRAVASVPKAAAKAYAPVTPEVAKDLYYDMRLGREFEEMCAQMYYRGKMFGFVHLYCGQEAVSTGVIRAMRADDYVCSTYRDHVHAISKGVAPREVMAELFGKKTGCCRGQGGSMHMFSAKNNFLGGYAFIGVFALHSGRCV